MKIGAKAEYAYQSQQNIIMKRQHSTVAVVYIFHFNKHDINPAHGKAGYFYLCIRRANITIIIKWHSFGSRD